jgi:formylglycine-generating enzyme required for sulfatase activity
MKTMMRCLVIVLFVGMISTQSNAQWVKTSLDSIDVRALAVSGNNLFVATDSGLFITTNNGDMWTLVKTGLTPNRTVNCFAKSSLHLFAGTDSGIFVSSNNGINWVSANTGFTDNISALAVSGMNLFAGTDSTICVSTNNGANWTKTKLGKMVFVRSIFISGDSIFTGTERGGIFFSSDNGSSWTATNDSLTFISGDGDKLVSSVRAFTTSGKYRFAGTGDFWSYFLIPEGKVFRATNNGTVWTFLASLPYVTSLVSSGLNIFAGTLGNGIYLSTNNGETWTAVNLGLTINNSNLFFGNVRPLAISSSYLFASSGYSVWRRPLSEMIPTTDSLLVPVAGGTFTAGTTAVTISGFKMDRYEVTYELWTEVKTWGLTHGYADLPAGRNGYSPVGTNNPVTEVSWYDIVKWCNARSEKDGLTPVYYTRSAHDTVYRTGELNINVDAVKWTANGFRLPTEAEWEFVARGGNSTHGYTYSGSNTLDSVAWYDYNSGYATHTVGTKKPNELGFYDMSGNVWEWCWDWYGLEYPTGGSLDPKGLLTTQTQRVIRGGGYYTGNGCGVGYRYANGPDGINYPGNRDYNLGFRCVQGSQNGTAVNSETRMPQTFVLEQNYPNPFNPSTTLRYSIPERSYVRLSIFNTLGQKISEIINETKDAGSYEQSFNVSSLSSGIYFYRIEATSTQNTGKTFVETKKMVLIR